MAEKLEGLQVDIGILRDENVRLKRKVEAGEKLAETLSGYLKTGLLDKEFPRVTKQLHKDLAAWEATT